VTRPAAGDQRLAGAPAADALDPLRYAIDFGTRWLREGSRLLAGRAASAAECLTGDPEAALLRTGELIREVQAARESMASYRRIDRLIARHRDALSGHAVDDARPERFVVFVGYSRSGHSLVGSLLDAHPEVVIAHELHALKHLLAGWPFADVVRAIRYNAHFFARTGRSYSGYDYDVPGQHQGRTARLAVAGDKKANGTGRVLRAHPGILDWLDGTLPTRTDAIHVIRHPLDNIATRAQRTGTSLAWAARGYFANADAIQGLRERHPDRVLDCYLDAFIREPRSELTRLLNALGVADIPEDYLDACRGVVFDAPSRSRDRVDWDPDLRRWIDGRMAAIPFLQPFVERPESA